MQAAPGFHLGPSRSSSTFFSRKPGVLCAEPYQIESSKLGVEFEKPKQFGFMRRNNGWNFTSLDAVTFDTGVL